MSATGSFRYQAADSAGSLVRGRVEATSRDGAADRLRAQGLRVIELRASRRWLPTRGIPKKQLAVVFRSLSSLVDAGVPFERALGATLDLVDGRLHGLLESVRTEILEGASVADAFGRHPGTFGPAVTGMIRAGEHASRLDEALGSVAAQLEHEVQFRSGIRSALAYPILLLIVGVVSVGIMGGVVLPRFATLLTDLGAELPASTRWLLAVSDALRQWAWLGAVGALGATIAWVSLGLGPRFRPAIHRTLLRVPIVGPLRHDLASARVCEALGSMLQTGVPVMAALEGARDAAADAEVVERLTRARDRVVRGHPLGQALDEERALTPSAAKMIRLGDASGTVGVLARKAATHLAEETRRTIQTLVGLFEPALILVLGGGIAIMAASLLRAVYSVRPG